MSSRHNENHTTSAAAAAAAVGDNKALTHLIFVTRVSSPVTGRVKPVALNAVRAV